MSPKEWAKKIGDLIGEAERDGMRFFISYGDFYVKLEEMDDELWSDEDSFIVW